MKILPLLRKLQNVTALTDQDVLALDDAVLQIDDLPARQAIIAEGERPACVHLILDGWAARCKFTRRGARQFTGFLVPGDFCDMHITVLARMDHAIETLTPCKVAQLSPPALDRLTRENSNLSRALWWSTLVDEAVLREWVVNNGQRTAYEAIAHILCEMHMRLDMVGLVAGDVLSFPLTQEDLASAAGLTAVHTNRVLQKLRQRGLIELRERVLTVLDLPGLEEAAGFDRGYFHLLPRHEAGVER
ncbi:conserved hypothetical protein [Altererythrobacter sp. B11]|uniref:Crp/Fnr family transcriptional regulator n=1 Tax=Altererythrobacter sp. B11 TaxID=2060312 RepID=UPI000DC707CE|nr:Crp/Fnr family transcriptional regulator [Altererythrobacter sp. B11]BBC71868.1 conserved hypothetical protein [Altererythrobacter sp. B11]